MRETAGIVDLTAFAYFDITGPSALAVVQKAALRQMDVAIGRVVYTPVLGPNGGFKSDLTIMRLDTDHFRVVTGGAHGMADKKWFADLLPADGSAKIKDITSDYTTLGVWGPNARAIVQAVTSEDMSHESFKFSSGITYFLRRRSGLGVLCTNGRWSSALGCVVGSWKEARFDCRRYWCVRNYWTIREVLSRVWTRA
jgi:glycine cleavage system aminomethyltransferase T